MQTKQSEYIGKVEAATRLKISERSVLDLAAKGKIQSKKERNEKTGQRSVMFNAADVERYGYERDNPPAVEKMATSNDSQVLSFQSLPPISIGMGVYGTPLSDLPNIRAEHGRGKLGPEHSTMHFRITEWVLPAHDSPFHKFSIEGPRGLCWFIATSPTCGVDLIKRLESAFQAGLQNWTNAKVKEWLTIKQAAEYSGLPESVLGGLILSGQLPAINCGPRPGGRWRVKRSDLETLEGHR